MDGFSRSFTDLELTISIPGFSSSSSLPSSGGIFGGGATKEFDINQAPSSGVEEDCTEEEDEITNNGGPPRKKLRLTKHQSFFLEECFRQHHTLNPKEKEALAMQLKLKPRQVEVWFQNRRARSKLKQTEMEYEYLKKWFGSLSEQNRRLLKEVEQLRAIKVSPPTLMSPHSCEPRPASTLTMCPRCERVTSTGTPLDNKGLTKTAIISTNTMMPVNNKGPPFVQSTRHSFSAC